MLDAKNMNCILSVVIWLPIIFGLIIVITGGASRAKLSRVLALIGSLLSFLATLPLYFNFDITTTQMQFQEFHAWIPALKLDYHLGIDGISILFILLNSLITLLVVVAGWEVINKHVSQYMAAFLVMSGCINGAFTTLNAILFYMFFEGMLIPMYLIIGIWGGPRRVYAAIKFFLYTLLGSLLMLVALIYLSFLAHSSFEILDFQHIPHIAIGTQILLFVAFFLSFAVKVPMWPVHTWLPDAHTEAPTGGSMVLAAVTLKIGAYGFLRFVLPILPDASRYFAPVMVVLSLIAVIYVGLVALIQSDMKKLVAYSSISHMGFATLGMFLFTGNNLNIMALEGSMIQMISHGFVSAAMFMCIGVLYDRMHTRNIIDYGGIVNKMPKFATFMLLFSMANIGLPGTSGFVGEFMVIMGSVQTNFLLGALAALTLVLGAAYTLWMYKRVVFGEIANSAIAQLKDVNKREYVVLAILVLAVLGMGLYPKMFSSIIHESINNLVNIVSQNKI